MERNLGEYARAGVAALALAALLGVLLPGPVRAATFQVEVNAGANALDGSSAADFPPASDTGLVPIGALPDSLSNSQSASAAVGTASADGFGSGQAELSAPGSFAGVVLRALATSEAVAPDGEYATAGFASGRSRVGYRDMLHVSGAPPGTPVNLRVTLELDGAMQRVGSPSPNHVQLNFADNGTPGAPIDQLSCTDLDGPCSESDTGEIEVLVGIPYGVNLELFTVVDAYASTGNDTFASASSDFNSTARACIDIITPGTSYTLDSGGDLRCTPGPAVAPALPPLALGALAMGLGIVGRRALRRR